jgi:outer membrane protein
MRLTRIIVVTVVLSFVFSFSCFAQEKICTVDLMRVFDEYKKRDDFDKDLEVKTKAKETQRNKLIDDVKEIQDKMALLSDKEKEKKQQELITKSQALQEFDQKLRMELRKDWDEKLRSILEDIKKSVEDFSKKEGYTLVIDTKALLYGSKDLDVTGKIVEILNKNYSKDNAGKR